jgi:hypothetical protein
VAKRSEVNMGHIPIEFTQEDVQRFERYLDKKTSNCWIFIGGKVGNSYGHFVLRTGVVLTHRFAYTIWKGPIEKGKLVLHTCDCPACCNPQHLILGDQYDNMRDCIKKGRSYRNSGERHHLSKISDEDRTQILFLRAIGISTIEIAKQFNLSRHHIYKIRKVGQ